MSSSVPSARPFTALVPVKPPMVGKSRLVGIDDAARARLAASFALDTVSALRAASLVHAVIVATDDAAFAAQMHELGAVCIPDGSAGDLNGTLVQTKNEAGRLWPHSPPVAVCADLPALRPDDIDDVLERASADVAWFVSDVERAGTTLYGAPPRSFSPGYGPGSRARHLEAGCRELPAPTSVSRDVDDLVDLQAAVALGVGAHTRAVLDDLRLF
ncbi:2-phospho-L-lactate guanylyltransferase [Nocardioides acrostichi]|uniref:2-phospho-L-lactate guanylyltransferase n=1 Tax=Nocardioides acrostichi TaxID=2784339 RepID=A0A930UT76_9ACTN|nr:2-phospho-L-lactate guanylyltransferase [Nocardioides acrostichi]MBF4160413.1 2-phospho-L-lactate guanylyltransferase [Nocardioides acrostichi]